jgi:hypothetical protein
MQHTTTSASRGAHRAVSAAVWMLAAVWTVAGIVALMALGGGLTRLAVVVAMVTTDWWLVSIVEDHFEGNAVGSGAKVAPVIHLAQR